MKASVSNSLILMNVIYEANKKMVRIQEIQKE